MYVCLYHPILGYQNETADNNISSIVNFYLSILFICPSRLSFFLFGYLSILSICLIYHVYLSRFSIFLLCLSLYDYMFISISVYVSYIRDGNPNPKIRHPSEFPPPPPKVLFCFFFTESILLILKILLKSVINNPKIPNPQKKIQESTVSFNFYGGLS